MAGIAAALKARALTVDVLALEARKAADTDHPIADGSRASHHGSPCRRDIPVEVLADPRQLSPIIHDLRQGRVRYTGNPVGAG
ncbi:hypothetical protein ACFZC6_27645 [Streptomyces ossamyceticus]|uniref:hypothetical protein n=1 Tax=Streptomyces ossamyceticus TaxID=249581 RepID=UPI0036EB13D3